MTNVGCPLGDASSFLVRVGEYARVSVVLKCLFTDCTVDICQNLKGG